LKPSGSITGGTRKRGRPPRRCRDKDEDDLNIMGIKKIQVMIRGHGEQVNRETGEQGGNRGTLYWKPMSKKESSASLVVLVTLVMLVVAVVVVSVVV
jgi:hypothetical protein